MKRYFIHSWEDIEIKEDKDGDFIYYDDFVSSILARIKELLNLKFNTTEKRGLDNFNTNSSIINELKNLIK